MTDAVKVVDKRGQPQPPDEALPDVLPVLPLREAVLFPNTPLPVLVGRERSMRLIEEVANGDRMLAAVTVRGELGDTEPGPEQLYEIGTAARIAELARLPQGGVQVILHGIDRIRVTGWDATEPYLRARCDVLEAAEPDDRAQALFRRVLSVFQEVAEHAPQIPQQFAVVAMNLTDPRALADFLAANMALETPKRQELLETLEVAERLELIEVHLRRELQLLELATKTREDLTEDVQKMQREAFLRRQLDVIRQELGEGDERSAELGELRRSVEEAGMPEDARKAADRELERLTRMQPGAPEETVSRTYLQWLLDVPWSEFTEDNADVEHARGVLDDDHYGLERIKERICEYLAVQKLRPSGRSPILCFVGPPGVGKTSLGQSIARALGRNFVRMSLGGVRDESEIRGHRRTYIGSMPGRIVQGLKRAGSLNPVMMLDEIDKMSAGIQGDPSAALLEVLDPAQNHAFSDHYLEVPVDLSRVMFICTANLLDPIPGPLRDRMEIIDLRGYTEPEKVEIAKRYLVPRQLEENGLKKSKAAIAVDALRRMIREYTYEAGVRNLEREIGSVLRKVALRVATGDVTKKVTVKAKDLPEMLGPPKVRRDVVEGDDEVGVATGLAWTPVGGDVLFVEATVVSGKGGLTLTGSLGDVMRESAQAAYTYARSRSEELGVESDWHERYDVHVHIPAGAIPKDGPSAGITLATALVSAVAEIPVRRTTAMTGEITLRGKVLPVGGIKEKVLAAHRAGCKTAILPKDNERDLDEVPDFVRKDLRFAFVEHIDEVLREALTKPLRHLKKPDRVSPSGSSTIKGDPAAARARA